MIPIDSETTWSVRSKRTQPRDFGVLFGEFKEGGDAFQMKHDLDEYYGFDCCDIYEHRPGRMNGGTWAVNITEFPLGFNDPGYAAMVKRQREERDRARDERDQAQREHVQQLLDEVKPWWKKVTC